MNGINWQYKMYSGSSENHIPRDASDNVFSRFENILYDAVIQISLGFIIVG